MLWGVGCVGVSFCICRSLSTTNRENQKCAVKARASFTDGKVKPFNCEFLSTALVG